MPKQMQISGLSTVEFDASRPRHGAGGRFGVGEGESPSPVGSFGERGLVNDGNLVWREGSVRG